MIRNKFQRDIYFSTVSMLNETTKGISQSNRSLSSSNRYSTITTSSNQLNSYGSQTSNSNQSKNAVSIVLVISNENEKSAKEGKHSKKKDKENAHKHTKHNGEIRDCLGPLKRKKAKKNKMSPPLATPSPTDTATTTTTIGSVPSANKHHKSHKFDKRSKSLNKENLDRALYFKTLCKKNLCPHEASLTLGLSGGSIGDSGGIGHSSMSVSFGDVSNMNFLNTNKFTDYPVEIDPKLLSVFTSRLNDKSFYTNDEPTARQAKDITSSSSWNNRHHTVKSTSTPNSNRTKLPSRSSQNSTSFEKTPANFQQTVSPPENTSEDPLAHDIHAFDTQTLTNLPDLNENTRRLLLKKPQNIAFSRMKSTKCLPKKPKLHSNTPSTSPENIIHIDTIFSDKDTTSVHSQRHKNAENGDSKSSSSKKRASNLPTTTTTKSGVKTTRTSAQVASGKITKLTVSSEKMNSVTANPKSKYATKKPKYNIYGPIRSMRSVYMKPKLPRTFKNIRRTMPTPPPMKMTRVCVNKTLKTEINNFNFMADRIAGNVVMNLMDKKLIEIFTKMDDDVTMKPPTPPPQSNNETKTERHQLSSSSGSGSKKSSNNLSSSIHSVDKHNIYDCFCGMPAAQKLAKEANSNGNATPNKIVFSGINSSTRSEECTKIGSTNSLFNFSNKGSLGNSNNNSSRLSLKLKVENMKTVKSNTDFIKKLKNRFSYPNDRTSISLFRELKKKLLNSSNPASNDEKSVITNSEPTSTALEQPEDLASSQAETRELETIEVTNMEKSGSSIEMEVKSVNLSITKVKPEDEDSKDLDESSQKEYEKEDNYDAEEEDENEDKYGKYFQKITRQNRVTFCNSKNNKNSMPVLSRTEVKYEANLPFLPENYDTDLNVCISGGYNNDRIKAPLYKKRPLISRARSLNADTLVENLSVIEEENSLSPRNSNISYTTTKKRNKVADQQQPNSDATKTSSQPNAKSKSKTKKNGKSAASISSSSSSNDIANKRTRIPHARARSSNKSKSIDSATKGNTARKAAEQPKAQKIVQLKEEKATEDPLIVYI